MDFSSVFIIEYLH